MRGILWRADHNSSRIWSSRARRLTLNRPRPLFFLACVLIQHFLSWQPATQMLLIFSFSVLFLGAFALRRLQHSFFLFSCCRSGSLSSCSCNFGRNSCSSCCGCCCKRKTCPRCVVVFAGAHVNVNLLADNKVPFAHTAALTPTAAVAVFALPFFIALGFRASIRQFVTFLLISS